MADQKRVPTMLHYAKRLTDDDMQVLLGKKPFTREAPREIVERLLVIGGHLKAGQFLIKMETSVAARELTAVIELQPAQVGAKKDDGDYLSLLPRRMP